MPRYEFGFRLSYKTFKCGDISVLQTNALKNTYATGPRAVGDREDLWDNKYVLLILRISNAGSVTGSEIAQLYGTADTPATQLRNFEKIFLERGGSVTVVFPLQRQDLSYWDVSAQELVVAAGTDSFNVDASSKDFRGSRELGLEGS